MERLGKNPPWAIIWVLWVAAVGCATTRTTDTPRTASEQLLISHAVDQALAKVDFRPLAGRAVFVQEKYLDGVDKNYVVASVRHQLLAAGSRLVDKDTEADVIVELRSGGVGTDRMESYVGTPRIDIPGMLPVQIPDVQLATNKRQMGTAKIGIIAYDAKTRQALGSGGVVLASSDDNNWFVLGIGPFRSGSMRQELQRTSSERSLPLELARMLPFVGAEPEGTPPPDQSIFVGPSATMPAGSSTSPQGPALPPGQPVGYSHPDTIQMPQIWPAH